ncbi:MAG: NAD(P)H-dependent glycerol-3-phosphate dehydrogenase [Verrucomicrobiales bacterium]
MKTIGIIGSGSWGTALGILLSGNATCVRLWGREPEVAAAVNQRRENPRYLPGLPLPPNLQATTTLDDLLDCDAILLVVPSRALRDVCAQLAERPFSTAVPWVSCIKGIENGTGLRMSQILSEALPGHPVAVLSGPNHAEEIARRLPAAAVIGCEDPALGRRLQELVTLPWFRAYTSEDLVGIEWGAAVKNVFAIASGLSAGLELGDNARAALVTRGLAEMIRLGTAMGGRPETFQGLSGVGDLVVTCYSHHSRNNRVGLALGRGQSLPDVLAGLTMVAEGVPNTESIFHAARRVGVRTPIIDTVYAVLYQNLDPREGLRALFARDPRPEAE